MNYRDKVALLKTWIGDSHRIVAITGAGISVPSGIPDFRSATGLYKTTRGIGRSPEYMLSHTCFEREPEEFYRFYRDKIIHTDAMPNDAHKWLKRLEDEDRLSLVITQNIDGLHEAAGSERLVTFHGTIYRNYCVDCGTEYTLERIVECDGVPHCSRCGGIVRPDVVLYEESLDGDNIERSVDAIRSADMLIVIGTSLVVYPAAGLVDYYRGDRLVLINKSSTGMDSRASLVINDDIVKVVHDLE